MLPRGKLRHGVRGIAAAVHETPLQPTWLKWMPLVTSQTSWHSVELAPEISFRAITPRNPWYRATEEVVRREGIDLPFWGFLWPGGAGVVRYILDNKELVEGKRVLDFACGGGASVVASLMSGAAHVHANDIDPVALAATLVSLQYPMYEALSLAGRVSFSHTNLLDPCTSAVEAWEVCGRGEGATTRLKPLHTQRERFMQGIDVVFAGDVLYDDDIAACCMPFFRYFAERGVPVVMGDPGRRAIDEATWQCIAEYDLPVALQADNYGFARSMVYEFKPKN